MELCYKFIFLDFEVFIANFLNGHDNDQVSVNHVLANLVQERYVVKVAFICAHTHCSFGYLLNLADHVVSDLNRVQRLQ